MKLKQVVSWIVGLAVVAGIGVGVWRWRASHAAPEVTYKTSPVEKKRVLGRVTASGTLSARVTVEVGAQVSGRISILNADFNSTVKKGDVIAKLDPQLYTAAMEQAQANHISAKANLLKAEATERDAQATLTRTKNLNEQGLAAASELQAATTAVSVAQASTEVAKASLKQTEAALHQAQVNLSYTTIHSPIDGVVISRSVDVGQTVAASLQAPVLFTIAEDLKKMQVHTSVAEGDVGRLQPEMEAWFTVDAFPGQRFKGKISQIRNAATTVQNVVTYDAVIDVDNPDLKLRPGMTATTTIVYAEKHDVLTVPNTALRFKPPAEVASTVVSASPPATLSITAASAEVPALGPAPTGRAPRMKRAFGKEGENPERTIYVLRGGRPEAIEVKIGLSDGSITELASGDVKEGEEVITEAAVSGKPMSSSEGAPRRMGRMF